MAFTVTTESINKGERTMTTRYLIHDADLAVKEYDYEPPYIPALDITTSHDKDRKMLVTTITRIRLNGRIVRWCMELRDEDPAPVNTHLGERILRYSAKALEARHEYVLSLLKPHHDDMVEWASRAKMR